jgi:hypothetical protein
MVTAMAQVEVEMVEMVEVEPRAMCLPHPLRSLAMVTGIRLDPATKTHNTTLLPTKGWGQI